MGNYIDLDSQSCDRIIGFRYTGNGEYKAVFDADETQKGELVSKDSQGFDNYIGELNNENGDITVIPAKETEGLVKETAGLRGTSRVRENIHENKCGNK